MCTCVCVCVWKSVYKFMRVKEYLSRIHSHAANLSGHTSTCCLTHFLSHAHKPFIFKHQFFWWRYFLLRVYVAWPHILPVVLFFQIQKVRTLYWRFLCVSYSSNIDSQQNCYYLSNLVWCTCVGDYSPSELWTVMLLRPVPVISACQELPSDSHANPPSCLVVVHVIVPFQQQLWVYHNHTDIAEVNCQSYFNVSCMCAHKYWNRNKYKCTHTTTSKSRAALRSFMIVFFS